jgi:Ca2+:H+ antiporter
MFRSLRDHAEGAIILISSHAASQGADMAAPHTDRISIQGWLIPLIALVAVLVIGKSDAWIMGAVFAALLIGSVMMAVHHAELVALWLGEPYGTLVLTLAVTIIELSLIVSLMLTGKPSPGLARDTVHAVVMLVVNGLAGICIVAGTLRHREQEFQTLGASAFLAVLTPMAMFVLVLPNHTVATPGPYYSTLQLIFVGSMCFALYLVFLFVQTVRHQDYFVPAGGVEADHAAAPPARIGAISGGLLLLTLVAVVLLAKLLAPFIERSIVAAGAPFKLAGVIVAAIVLLPECVAALRAARRNQLQTSINLALGSAVACIGLTVPAVTVIATWLGQPLALGIDNESTVLLLLSFLVAMLTYGQGRTNLLSGFVHLVLLASYVFLIFAP